MATRMSGPVKFASSSATSTIVKTTSDTTFSAAISDLVVVFLGANNSTVTFGCSDSAGNTWTLETQNSQSGASIVCAWTRVTVAIPTNGSITITHASLSRRVTSVQGVTGITGTVSRDILLRTATGTTSPMASGSSGTLAEADECVFNFTCVQDGGTPTTITDASSGWTNLGTLGNSGGTVSSVTLGGSYRETAATTAVSDSPTDAGTISRWVGMLVSFQGISGGTPTPPATFELALLGAGA